MRRRLPLLPLGFALLLALPLALTLLKSDRSFSENENRYLALRPRPAVGAFLSGTLQRETEDWLADQFPGRDSWKAAATLLDRAAGRREIGGAWLGKDGYYIEAHPAEAFDWDKYRRNLGYLGRLAERCGVPAAALLAPSAGAALPELLPEGAADYDADAALLAARELLPAVTIPDLKAALRAEPREQVYYRTDHHWTVAGMKRAYDALPAPFGRYQGQPELFSDSFLGSTYSRTLDPAAQPDSVALYPVAETVSAEADGAVIPVYDLSTAERKDKYNVYLGGNHGLVKLTGGCQNGKTLLVLKDSFANCLAPLLTADYETVLLVDLRYYPGTVRSLAAQVRPDALLFVYEMSGLAAGDDFVKLLLQ